MKKTSKRLLSMALVLVMVLSLLPAVTVPTLAADDDTKDAFGITMAEWTEAEKAAAEADLPFGTGYGTWTTLLEKNELFFSMGYDSATRLTGLFDWNGTEGTTVDTIVNAIGGFGQSKLTSKTEEYKAVATAAMDLYGTGKKEYVANLALNANNGTLSLYVTDSSNNLVADGAKIYNVAQLSSMEVHQLNGAFSITAGDFDGDGKDTVVVYVPRTGPDKNTKNGLSPFIKEYAFTVSDSGVSCTAKSTVAANVLTMLGNNTINEINTMKNQPMVDLVAEDVDKDGFDELIVTGGMNDVTNSDHYLESHIFIYDQQESNASFTWNCSYDKKLAITSENNKRVVWASSTVGNIIVNTSTTSVDYPEIITAGFIDGEQSNTQHINVGGGDEIGVTAVRVKSVQNTETKNVICEYEEVLNQKLSPNSWTKGGFYESEDVNGLLQVQAYADRGLGYAESVFISGTVYRINSDNKLEKAYQHNDFNGKDDFAPGGRTLTNTTVTAVTAGNFDGNDEGREQLICVTTLKQSGKNNAYSRVYCYYAKDDGSCDSKRSSYLTEHKGNFYVSLAALDTDNDSVIAKLESVERDYSAPDVLAILEASPYFAEINDSFGNSETTYGKAESSGNGSTNTFGFTLGVSVGYEFESDLVQSGGGFELAVDNAFNWGTANTTTVEWFTEFRNDSGDNLVVVYRCPVVTYRYVDLNGKELVVEKVGPPATSMITVDEYNEAADQYAGLDPIDETNVKLGDPGDPFSYRSSTDGLTNAVAFYSEPEKDKWGEGGWTQYYGSGSIMQGLTITQEQEKTFSYDLAVSKNVFVKVGGVTAGATYGFTYGYENTHISGSSVTKSGAVTGAKEDGYDFQWKFAAWNCTLNGSTVPVLGYLVKDVVAPPSPAMGLTAESFTTDSVTLRWSSGIRPAEQYRIYRVRDTDPQYVLVGAVQGDQTSFKLTGLKPGETYTYVVRGVGYQPDHSAVESVDSAPITVRTQSEDSSVTLSLYGSSLTGSTLQSTGAAADISVQVTGTSGSSLSYQWQLLEAGTEGVKHGWLRVDTLAGKTIGTVTGAKSGTLTLRSIDGSLNGSSLRCVVTVNSTAGDVDTYYSPVATLDLSGLDTTTTISVSGNTGGSGSITDPYTGTANYTTVTEESSGSYVYVPATVTDSSGKEYTIYQDADNKAYVGAYDEVDTETDTSSRTYYAVTKSGDTYTLGAKLTLDADQYIIDNNGEHTIPEGFDGTLGLYENSNTVRYEKRYVVVSSGSTTLKEYWFNTSDGQYYTKSGNVFTPANPQPSKTIDENGNETGDDLRMVYYDDGSTVILSAVGTDDYDHYQVYTVTSGVATAGASFYRVPGTKLYKSSETEPYADSAKLTIVTVQQEVLSTVTTSVSGTQLTLSASVNPSNGGTVSFTITNTDTGAVTQITANNGTATWTAPKAGLYRIVATAAATTTTKSSSAECYYRADDPNNDYRLIVKQNGEQVTNISYNGSPVALKLENRTNGTWGEVNSNVSYKVNNTAFSGSSYTPNAAGSYLFSAVVDGKTVATAVLVVNKMPITVTPTWDTSSTIPAYSDIKLAVTDAQGNTLSDPSLNGIMKVSCDLYNGTSIKQNAASGVYTVTPTFVNDAAKTTFLSRYSVTLNTAAIYYSSGAITVYFSAGENGEVYARYIDPSGTEFAFDNGSQISMDYRLKFVAEPKSGWSVEKWTVMLGQTPVNAGWYSIYSNTLEITETGMKNLKTLSSSSGQKELTVSVTFTDQTHQITYSHGEGGSLSAAADNTALTNGAFVAHNATVIFTAVPNTGMMVEKWTVDGAEYKWDGTDALYRENTLTLENIDSDHDVRVSFTTKATTNVIASAVDAEGASYSAATVTVTDAQGNTLTGDALKSVPQSSALTFTATIDNSFSAVVKEWQTSTDGTNWTTVTDSGGKGTITIYEHGEKLYVRVVIAVAQTYELSWNVAGLETGDETKATLTAKSGTVDLTSGGSYAVTTPVTFTLSLDNSYYVVGWTNATQSSTDPKSATLTLTDTTAVTVTVAKKPTVSWTDPTGGTISVKGTVNGTANAPVTNGSYVDPNTTITVTAAPGDGYVVESIQSDTAVNTNKSNGAKSKAITVTTSNVTVTASFLAKPIVTISNSESDKGGVEFKAIKDGSEQTLTANSYVDFGSSITVTLKPNTGYEVGSPDSGWKAVPNSDNYTYTIANVQTDQTIAPTWSAIPQYDVTYSVVDINGDAEGGTNGSLAASVNRKSMAAYEVDPFTSGGKVYRDSTVTFTATPDSGYRVKEWRVNNVVQETDGITDISTTLTLENLSADATVTVQFTRLGNSITIKAGSNGSITSAMAGGIDQINNIANGFGLAEGASVVITAQPDTGYEVEKWTVNGETVPGETGNTYTYTAQADSAGAVIAVFFQQVEYSVIWTGTNGTVVAAGYTGTSAKIRGGTEVTFTATPDEGYVVTGWKVNGATVEGQTNSTFAWTIPNGKAADPVANSYTIEAIFSRGSYVVTVIQPDHATITADPDVTDAVTGGTEVTFTATPDDGYIVIGWTVDDVTTDSRSTTHKVTINKATTVTAVIVPAEYNVTYSGSSGGTVTATGYDASPASVPYGGSITFTAAPDAYYHVKEWQVDGKAVPNSANQNTYTLSDVTAEHTVTAVFAGAVTYEVGYEMDGGNGTLGATANGTALVLTPGQTAAVPGNSRLVFTAAPSSNYMVAKWSVSKDNGNTYEVVTSENMAALGLTMSHYLANVLTLEKLESNFMVKVEFEQYVGYDIPQTLEGYYTVTDITRNPNDTLPATQIRKNGDVTFTVAPVLGKELTALTIGGVDCLTEPSEGNVTAVKNDDGSYTITVKNVTADLNPTITAEEKTYTVTILQPANGGTLTVKKADGSPVSTGAKVPVGTVLTVTAVPNSGFVLGTLTVNGTASGLTFTLTGDVTIAATFEHLVIFNANGGSVSPTSAVTVNNKLTSLPTPVRSGYTFSGWYTAASGGAQVTLNTVFATNTTIYAHWTANSTGGGGGGGSSASKNVIIYNAEHGRITAIPESAAPGQTVILVVAPEKGYELGSLTAFDSEGNRLTLTKYGSSSFTFTMPNSAVIVRASFVKIVCYGGVTCPSYHFTDVSTSLWYHEAIDYVVENGIMNGVGGGKFDPNGNLSRAMLMTMLARLNGVNTNGGATWYEKGLNWAVETGVSDGTNLNADISRQEVATMLYRFARLKGYDTSARGDLNAFIDGNQTASWAQEAMEWAVASGIFRGDDKHLLNPQGSATRAEIAQIFMNYMENIVK